MHPIHNESGQAAIEAIYSVLVVLLLMLAACQLLYSSLVSAEAVKDAHRKTLALFREMNTNGSDLNTVVEESISTIRAEPGQAYGRVVNNWSLFHKDYQPETKPHARYSNGEQYVAKRGILIAAGPLKGIDEEVDTVGEGRSAFGVRGMPLSDGDGYNVSARALRNDAFKELCYNLGIQDIYFH